MKIPPSMTARANSVYGVCLTPPLAGRFVPNHTANGIVEMSYRGVRVRCSLLPRPHLRTKACDELTQDAFQGFHDGQKARRFVIRNLGQTVSRRLEGLRLGPIPKPNIPAAQPRLPGFPDSTLQSSLSSSRSSHNESCEKKL
jgi:hypothetical protein